jgi:NCS2 family nucleobase:cation symporter-2
MGSRDIDFRPPLAQAAPLGLQHVLAMFVGNVAVPLIVADAIDLPVDTTIFLVQAAMFVAGVATIVQALGLGPLGARVPIVMGTSFGFVPVVLPIAVNHGLPAVFGAALVGGLAMAAVGLALRWVRFLFPPVVTGTFVIMIGIILLPVGIAYVGGGAGAADFGAMHHIGIAVLVFVVTIAVQQFAKGILSEMAVLIGIVVGYVAAVPMGLVDFSPLGNANWVQLPVPFKLGIEFVPAAIASMILISVVTSAESIGDIEGTMVSAADRQPTDKELSRGVMTDGLASSFGAVFSAFPQISFSQNVGLIALTGVASRYVVAVGGVFLMVAGLLPKLGAVVTTIPSAVLGGAVTIMFGMIVSAGIKMLAGIEYTRRNMLIIGVSIAVAIGLRFQEAIYANAPTDVQAILHSGLVPGALMSIILNLILPGRSK